VSRRSAEALFTPLAITANPPTTAPVKGGGSVGGAIWLVQATHSANSAKHPPKVGGRYIERPCHHCGERSQDHYAGLLGCRVGRSFYAPALALGLAS
jgi:hypothetical protein